MSIGGHLQREGPTGDGWLRRKGRHNSTFVPATRFVPHNLLTPTTTTNTGNEMCILHFQGLALIAFTPGTNRRSLAA